MAPFGDSPWPTDGWLVLLGDGAQLRPGALQGLERWLIDNQQEHNVCHHETSLFSLEIQYLFHSN